MSEETRVSVVKRPEAPEEQALREALDKLVWQSPDQLDAAARQIVTLVTSLYGVLFGVLAFANDPLPAYLTWPAVRALGAGATVALGLALGAALVASHARRYTTGQYHLEAMRQTFQAILQHKSRWLTIATVCFAAGLAALGALLVVVMWHIE